MTTENLLEYILTSLNIDRSVAELKENHPELINDLITEIEAYRDQPDASDEED